MNKKTILKSSICAVLLAFSLGCASNQKEKTPIAAKYVIGAKQQKEASFVDLKEERKRLKDEAIAEILSAYSNAPIVETNGIATRLLAPDTGPEIANMVFEKNDTAEPLLIENRLMYPFGVGGIPVLKLPGLAVSDLQFEPGEEILSYTMGDSERWLVSEVLYAAPGDTTPHMSIRPTENGLNTNMVIYTTKRTYSLVLEATKETQTNLFGFYYPYQGFVKHAKKMPAKNKMRQNQSSGNSAKHPARKNQTNINVDEIQFNWAWDGNDNLPWYPEVVFDDGEKTFIGLDSKKVKASELPVFFVLGESEENEIVNYRYRAPYIIVDHIFENGVLLRGVGDNQERVIIKHLNR